MRLVKIKDALPSDDLNLVGIEKDHHLAVFFISNQHGVQTAGESRFKSPKKSRRAYAVLFNKIFFLPPLLPIF